MRLERSMAWPHVSIPTASRWLMLGGSELDINDWWLCKCRAFPSRGQRVIKTITKMRATEWNPLCSSPTGDYRRIKVSVKYLLFILLCCLGSFPSFFRASCPANTGPKSIKLRALIWGNKLYAMKCFSVEVNWKFQQLTLISEMDFLALVLQLPWTLDVKRTTGRAVSET